MKHGTGLNGNDNWEDAAIVMTQHTEAVLDMIDKEMK